MRPIPQPAFDINDAELLEKLVKQAFSRRRKTLRNALDGVASAEDMQSAGLDSSQRPEQIPIAGWVNLANLLADSQ
jgi:16S rRNA (adenine1518-N6/adenine1519-N6)-dimethyltransferase